MNIMAVGYGFKIIGRVRKLMGEGCEITSHKEILEKEHLEIRCRHNPIMGQDYFVITKESFGRRITSTVPPDAKERLTRASEALGMEFIMPYWIHGIN